MAALDFPLEQTKENLFGITSLENLPSADEIRLHAQAATYQFLYQNHEAFETKAKRLDEALKKSQIGLDSLLRKQYELYLLHYHTLLESYAKCREEPLQKPNTFINMVHDNLILMHAYRITLAFVFFTNKLVLQLLNDAHFLDAIYSALGPAFDFQLTLDILTAPGTALNILSFSLLGLRFFIESMRILQHVFFPTEQEKEISAWERFTHEVYKYRYNLINDLVWFTLNGIGNFPTVFHITPFTANFLFMAGLLFDLSLLVYRLTEIQAAYNTAEAALSAEEEMHGQDIDLLKKQRDVLALERCEVEANMHLSLFAASTLITGFALLLTAPVPALAPVGSFFCIVGTAIYLAAGKYAEYQKESAYIEQLKESGVSLDSFEMRTANVKRDTIWHDGWLSFARDVFLPLLFITALAISWPVGVLLLVAYATYTICTAATQAPENETEMSSEKLKLA